MTALDGLGSFVFASSGGLLAVEKRFDLFGVLLLSFAVAVTGGITRDLLIGAVPPAAVASWHTLAIAVLGGLLTFYVYSVVQSVRAAALGVPSTSRT
ncbi:trimeric intracellular cation channel family protein [Methylobacterium oxalidis]|uniref:trimeric intracellular cation channel family protein n=1 Tax=Methylobacterium oxalidis TaxID=944322 RepID=UPI0033151349